MSTERLKPLRGIAQRLGTTPESSLRARLVAFRGLLLLGFLVLTAVWAAAQVEPHRASGRDGFMALADNVKIAQPFGGGGEPVSLVVVLDASENNRPATFRASRAAVTEIVKAVTAQDDLGLVISHNEAEIAVPLGRPGDIERVLDTIQPGGFAAVWDAMFLATKELENAPYGKKVMMVISDGGDEISRHTPSELESRLRKAEVEVYAIGAIDLYASRLQQRVRPVRFANVVAMSGGRVFPAFTGSDFLYAAAQASHEMRSQQVMPKTVQNVPTGSMP